MEVLEVRVCSYARQSHKGLLLHNLIQYRKSLVFPNVTDFKLLKKLW